MALADEQIGSRAVALHQLGRDFTEISEHLGVELRRVETLLGTSTGPLPARTCRCGSRFAEQDEDGVLRCFACGKARAV